MKYKDGEEELMCLHGIGCHKLQNATFASLFLGELGLFLLFVALPVFLLLTPYYFIKEKAWNMTAVKP